MAHTTDPASCDNNSSQQGYSRELRVRGVSKKLRTELKNIAAWHGVTMSAFLKDRLVGLAASYPEHQRLSKPE